MFGQAQLYLVYKVKNCVWFRSVNIMDCAWEGCSKCRFCWVEYLIIEVEWWVIRWMGWEFYGKLYFILQCNTELVVDSKVLAGSVQQCIGSVIVQCFILLCYSNMLEITIVCQFSANRKLSLNFGIFYPSLNF